MIEIGKVAAPLHWDHWQTAKAMLTPALDRSDEAWPDVESELSADTMQLAAVVDGQRLLAVVVTRSALTIRGEVLELYLCGGIEMRRWLSPFAEWLKRAARDAGMIGVRIIGRLGWERALKDNGFVVTAIVLEAA